MGLPDFVNDSHVKTAINEIKTKKKNKEYHVSDVVDDKGNQYVDLVMEGGGMLGIALVGYTYALEMAGIRFLHVGGTSAGAINAALMAGAGTPPEEKSLRILDELAQVNFLRFVDGDGDARDFVKAMSHDANKFVMIWKGAQVLDNICEDYGLNPGEEFRKWVHELLKGFKAETKAKLEKKMKTQPEGLRCIAGDTQGPIALSEEPPKLALITADITTSTKVEFPRMAELYWKNSGSTKIADFVRASMSIPFFFHPFRATDIPDYRSSSMDPKKAEDLKTKWKEWSGYVGPCPSEALFVDGGIMSNFPIDVFHNHEKVPRRPTLGAKLGIDRQKCHATDKVGKFTMALFDTARHNADYDFILKHPDFKQLVAMIDTIQEDEGGNRLEEEIDWLDFEMENPTKILLFRRGVEAAKKFLDTFNWADYKKYRQNNLRKVTTLAPGT